MKKIRTFIIIFLLILLFVILIKNYIIIFPQGNIDGINYSSYEKIEIKKSSGMASGKPWDELTISEQHNEMKSFNNTVYKSSDSKPISDTLVNEKIGEWLDNNKIKLADIYSLKDISVDTAVALKFNNSTEYYTYINQVCPEMTLKEFINKYNLIDDNLIFDSIDYTKVKNNKKLILEIKDISHNEIKNLILNNLDINLSNYYEKIENPLITIHASSNIYGNGITFYLTENNTIIIDIPSIKKSLSCNLPDIVLNTLLENIKNNSDTHLKIYFEKFELFGSTIVDL